MSADNARVQRGCECCAGLTRHKPTHTAKPKNVGLSHEYRTTRVHTSRRCISLPFFGSDWKHSFAAAVTPSSAQAGAPVATVPPVCKRVRTEVAQRETHDECRPLQDMLALAVLTTVPYRTVASQTILRPIYHTNEPSISGALDITTTCDLSTDRALTEPQRREISNLHCRLCKSKRVVSHTYYVQHTEYT